MLILGIFAYQHDASACLIKDGKILGFVEEERLNREKHSALFPKNSIEYLFKTYNFKFEDIDYITFCWDVKKEFFSNLKSFIFNIPQSLNLLKSGAAQNDLSLLSRLKKQFFLKNEFLINGFSLSKKTKIVEIEHHLGHAASVFLVSEFDESAIITWDGRGEKTSILISHGKSNKIEKIKEIQIPNARQNTTHSYYIYPIVLNLNLIPVNRARIKQALEEEGVQGLSEGYVNIHRYPIFQKKIAYGKNGFPWNSSLNSNAIDYSVGICPVAEELHDKSFLAFNNCHYDLKESEVRLIGKAFRKVFSSLNEL